MLLLSGNGTAGNLLGRLPRIDADLQREWGYSRAAREMKAALKQIVRQEGRQFVQRNYVWSGDAEILERMCFEAVAHAHSRKHLAAESSGSMRQGKHAEETQ